MGSKETYIQRLFSSVAGRYDLLNTLLSLNRDKYWRKFAVSKAEIGVGEKALDVATGTGELALELAKKVGGGGKVVGVDFCEEMLDKAHDKLAKAKYHNVDLTSARAESLPFPDNTFDCATIAFALRNVTDIKQTLQEMTRVVRDGARVVCLEFSQPQQIICRGIYRLYLFRFLPFFGRLISGSKDAYLYLPQSIVDFSSPHELKRVMEKVGLRAIEIHSLTMGIATVYVGTKEVAPTSSLGRELGK